MADTKQDFTENLPARIAKDPALAQSVNAVYQFDIAGAGTWTLDLTPAGNKVTEGAAAEMLNRERVLEFLELDPG